VVFEPKPKSSERVGINKQSNFLMKKSTLLVVCIFFFGTYASATVSPWNKSIAEYGVPASMPALTPEMAQMGLKTFLDLTPAEYHKVTGKRMGMKNALALKSAQKQIKQDLKRSGHYDAPGDGITEGVYILLAIFGLAWIAMGVKSDWEGSDWIVNLLLTLLCWLPGLIHALIKKKDYFP